MTVDEILAALQAAVADANIYHGENTREAYYSIESIIVVAENLAETLLAKDPNFDAEAFLAAAATPKLSEPKTL
jgi:hypothetical protein